MLIGTLGVAWMVELRGSDEKDDQKKIARWLTSGWEHSAGQ
jgi:hypothetical protein